MSHSKNFLKTPEAVPKKNSEVTSEKKSLEVFSLELLKRFPEVFQKKKHLGASQKEFIDKFQEDLLCKPQNGLFKEFKEFKELLKESS